MAKAKVSNYEIVSSLFPSTPATWDSRINLSSRAMWDEAKVVIAGDQFAPLRNEIFNQLINRIGIVKIHERIFNNPLSQFKNGAMNFGDTIQEIATDVVEAKQFDNGYSNQFETEEPNVKACYHRVNRKQFYKITVHDADLQYAFTEEYGLQQLLNRIINSLTNSNIIDEFLYTKRLITSYVDNSEYPLLDSQILEVPHISTRSRSADSLKYFLEDVKTCMRMMRFPNRKYNSARQMNQVDASDMTLIMNANITSINEVNNLASAFNPEYMDLNIPIISVDQISEKDPSIIGAIVTSRSLDIRNTKETMRIAENAQSLYTNYFYHIHQIYTASPFENMVLIREAKAG